MRKVGKHLQLPVKATQKDITQLLQVDMVMLKDILLLPVDHMDTPKAVVLK
jgi:hypothetical protein